MRKLYAASLFAIHRNGIASFVPATLFAANDNEATGVAFGLARQHFNESEYVSHAAVVMAVPEDSIREAYEELPHE